MQDHSLDIPHRAWARIAGLTGLFLALAGLVISPVAMSVGTGLMFAGALASLPFRVQIRKFLADKASLFLSGFVLIHLISWFVTFDKEGWLDELRIKIPLLLILYALAVLGPFSRKEVKLGVGLLIMGVFFTGTASFINYLENKEVIDEAITRSKPMVISFSISHIYFSVVMGFSILAAVWFWREKTLIFHKAEKWFIGLLTLINFGYLHVLTTRTGLVACYLTILILGLIYLLKQRRYLAAAVLSFLVFAAPVVGYFTMSSFKFRVDNTWMDVSRYFSGKDPNYLSIGTRIESWKTAVNVFRKQPVLGTGTADIMEDMYYQYVVDESLLCPENQVEPHNQFIHTLTGNGIIGFVVLCLAWFYPVFIRRKHLPYLFQAFWLIYFFAMLGEATLERQIGIMFIAISWSLFRSPSLLNEDEKS